MPPHDYTPAVEELSLEDSSNVANLSKAPAPLPAACRPRYESYFSERGRHIRPGGIR